MTSCAVLFFYQSETTAFLNSNNPGIHLNISYLNQEFLGIWVISRWKIWKMNESTEYNCPPLDSTLNFVSGNKQLLSACHTFHGIPFVMSLYHCIVQLKEELQNKTHQQAHSFTNTDRHIVPFFTP